VLGRNIVRLSVKEIEFAIMINKCLEEGWEIRNVRQMGDALELELLLKNSKDFIKWVRREKGKVQIKKRQGSYLWWKKLQKRKGIAIGSALAFSIVYLGLSYIWSYEIEGNVRYTTEEIIDLAESYGLKIGAAKSNLNYEEISRQILKDYNEELSWIWLNSKGTVLQIRLKEKDNGDKNMFRPANLVASKDGRVERILVLKGEAQVNNGDYVKKGQILIAGKEYDAWLKDETGRFIAAGGEKSVQAKGVICGICVYRSEGVCALWEENLEIGPKTRRYKIQMGDRGIFLKAPSEQEVIYEEVWRKVIGSRDWQIALCAVDEYRGVKKYKEYTYEEAYEQALKRAREKLREQLGEREVVNENITTTIRDRAVKVEIEWAIREDLAIEQYE